MSLGRMMLLVSLFCVAFAVTRRPAAWVCEQIDWQSFFDGAMCFYRLPLWCIGIEPNWFSSRPFWGNDSVFLGFMVGFFPAALSYFVVGYFCNSALVRLWNKTRLN